MRNRCKCLFRKVAILIYGLILFMQSQDIPKLFIVNKPFLESSEIISTEIKDNNGLHAAGLLIYSDLTDLSFNVENSIVKIDKNPGKYLLYLSPKERYVEIYCDNYLPLKLYLHEYGVNLTSGIVWSFTVSSVFKNVLKKGSLYIETDPSDANVKILAYNDIIKSTPALFENYPAGNYKIEIQKSPVYRKKSADIQIIEGEINKYYYLLEQTKATLKIELDSTQAAGTSIIINDSLEGTSSSIFHLTGGIHQIKVVKYGYSDYQNKIELSDNQEVLLKLKLSEIAKEDIRLENNANIAKWASTLLTAGLFTTILTNDSKQDESIFVYATLSATIAIIFWSSGK